MQDTNEYPGSLSELTADECWTLLLTRPFGRVAWSGPDGTQVIPINYLVDHDAIVLRTTPYSNLAQQAVGLEVAFQVDHIDEETRTGWSVLARGHCHHADPPPTGLPEVWVAGTRVLVLLIDVRTVSGRRIRSFFEPA